MSHYGGGERNERKERMLDTLLYEAEAINSGEISLADFINDVMDVIHDLFKHITYLMEENK